MSRLETLSFHLDDEADRQAVYETDEIQIMRIRLQAGEALPTHKANSNALLLPLRGAVKVQTEEGEAVAVPGEAIPVAYDTRMDVSNHSTAETVLLVLKTPHPRQFGGTSA